MTMNKEVEFNNIVNDIIKNEEFIELKYELHHGLSRLDHSLSVAHLTYNICNIFNLRNTFSITRAALLHDFFKDSEVGKLAFVNHPMVASRNAMNNFNINKMQKNIIESHMFPISKTVPKSIGSHIVSIADKIVAIKECTKYKVPLTIGATFLFILNFSIRQINW